MANRLKASLSPYLLQHAEQPVHWWEWGEEAFAAARSRDLPVLLSVGYAACHWCHVMAHESFDDPHVAALLNEHAICIKVDREEHPDVDAAFMAATVAMTGRGGWPMTVFLDHEGRPFHAGTYYPPTPQAGLASFTQVLLGVSAAWCERRETVTDLAERVCDAIRAGSIVDSTKPSELTPAGGELLGAAVHGLLAREDRKNGGFGGAPKFPPTTACAFLLRHAGAADELPRRSPLRTNTDSPTERSNQNSETQQLAADLVTRTLTAMACGGIYDQLAGGFARYSVDAEWAVPHFEKMLHDNALLTDVYLRWWIVTGEPLGAQVAQECASWLATAMATPEDGLASSLDADTLGIEGATYLWTRDELVSVLGKDEGNWAATLLGVGSEPSTLRFTNGPLAVENSDRWEQARKLLLTARNQRAQPDRDDKVVTAWSGWSLGALARVGALFEREDLISAAVRVAEFLLTTHLGVNGALCRVSREGKASNRNGVLEDYAGLADGLLDLHAVTGDRAYLDKTGELLAVIRRDFVEEGRLVDTSTTHADPLLATLGRPRELFDGPGPAPTWAATRVLARWGVLTEENEPDPVVATALSDLARLAPHAPREAGWGLATLQDQLSSPRLVTIYAQQPSEQSLALARSALSCPRPGVEVVWQPLPEGWREPAAVICRGFTCQAPITDPAELTAALAAR